MPGGRSQRTGMQELLALVLPGSVSITIASSRAGDSVDCGGQEVLLCLQLSLLQIQFNNVCLDSM